MVYLPPKRAAVLALGLGTVFILGGEQRIQGASYATIRAYGGHNLWGLGLLGLAIILWAASSHLARVLFHAYGCAATGYGLFALAVFDAARNDPGAGLTGIVMYAWVAYIHAVAASAVSRGRVAAFVLRRRTKRGQ